MVDETLNIFLNKKTKKQTSLIHKLSRLQLLEFCGH